MNKAWWLRRWEAFLDNAIFFLIALVVAPVVIAAIFGTSDAAIPLWVVVLFGALLLAEAVAVAILFARVRRLAAERPPEAAPLRPHPYARLLSRLDALDSSVAELHPSSAIRWPIAETFNQLVDAAAEATQQDAAFERITRYEREPGGSSYAYSGEYGELRAMIGQVKSIVEHAPSPDEGPRTGARVMRRRGSPTT